MQSRFHYPILVSVFMLFAAVAFGQTGIMTIVAGNGTAGDSGDGRPAPLAQLYNPDGVAVDAAGNLYIADFNNNVIRKVASTTGLITTIAGTPGNAVQFGGDGGPATSAFIKNPEDIAV